MCTEDLDLLWFFLLFGKMINYFLLFCYANGCLTKVLILVVMDDPLRAEFMAVRQLQPWS